MSAPTLPTTSPRTASGSRSRATGLLARRSTRAGVLAPADVHVAAPRSARLGGETDDAGAARRRAGRARRCGSGRCASTSPTVDRTVLGEGDEVVDISDLPWPEPAAVAAACAAQPAGRRRPDGRRAAAAAGRRPALPRAVLAAGGAGPRRARRPRAARRRRPSTPTGCAPGWTGCSPSASRATTRAAARRRGRRAALGQRARRRPGHRQDHHRRAAARAAAATRTRHRCGSRSPRPPARRPRGWRRPCAEADDSAGRPRALGDLARLDAAPAARLAAAARSRFRHDRHRPAAVRRRRRRRDVDGVADADGPAARGGPPRRPPRARRRPRPARVGRGRRRARRPRRARPAAPEPALDAALRRGRRAGPAWCTAVVTVLDRTWRFRGADRRRSPPPSGPATRTRPSRLLRAGADDVEFVETASSTARDPPGSTALRADVVARRAPRPSAPPPTGRRRAALARARRAPAAVRAPARARTASRAGPREIERWLAERERRRRPRRGVVPPAGRCWSRPTTTTRGLYNGDTGVVVGHRGRRAGGVRPRRRARAARARPGSRRRDRARDDRAPRAGQPVRPRHGHPAARRVAAAHPRAALHRGRPAPRTRVRSWGSRTPSAPPSPGRSIALRHPTAPRGQASSPRDASAGFRCTPPG